MIGCDVLVVGLGPVGASMAALAMVHGLKVVAVEREADVYPLPRAAVFDHEIMRIFQTIGVTDKVAPVCRVPDRYQFLTADGDVLLDFPVAEEGPYGWAETYALHQPAVELALRERVDDLGVDVRLGTSFVSLRQHADRVDVQLRGADGPGVVSAKYVVGCDGASSPVREACGIGLEDYRFDEPWLVIDAIIEEPGDLPIVCQQICDPARPVTHMAMSGNRFRWEFMLKPGESPDEMLQDGRIHALLAPWNCSDRMIIERKAVYRFHGLVADRWRDRRVLLAGDAAHQMPPFAGQGMCSGIRDVSNLAWKLATVVRGQAPDAALDSYQDEREPHVRAIIETAIAMGKVVCMLDADAAAMRNIRMLARKRSGAQDVSVKYPDLKGGWLDTSPLAGALMPQPVSARGTRLDEALGLAPTLLVRDGVEEWRDDVRVLPLTSAILCDFRAPLHRWFDEVDVTAVLVRPDRHIFGTGTAASLLTAWAIAARLPVAA